MLSKSLKTITAGCLIVQALYPRRGRRDSDKARAAKSKASTDAQKRMNDIYSVQKLELMLAANFPRPGSALVVTMPFDDAHMPHSRAESQRRFKYFLKLLRDARRAAGLPEPVVFWAIEVLTSASGRWHVHAVIDSTGEDAEMLRSCWRYGSDIEFSKLRVDGEKNHETQARYMSKELRACQDYDSKPGLHGWSCTRNAKRPTVEVEAVGDDFEIAPPSGVTVLFNEERATEYASYRVVKYRTAFSLFQRPPRAKRRRKRLL